ncbi:FAD-dependent thymidylate synthase [Ammonifex thiophilus]|uniref:Flavin-dependent thymidylate synthase n=1 Tax=Ammonifex thiophilus TaxID=444093 RepID=A0A3D8P269_9THEO|nr:FAD-dependent thymidylate synthase [Ammonifex thiophilus]RDV82297.1 FAD-dependent thymidylate synthase [Ammonifex thiophilus]
MKVTLIAHTPEPEKVIAFAARRCYSALPNDELWEKVKAGDYRDFLRKLIRRGHLTPVEHASFTFAVEGVSRACLAQITRHRIASFSVQSQRYVKGFNFVVPPAVAERGKEGEFLAAMEECRRSYEKLLEFLPAEDARFVLPQAAETKFVVTMNARELLHFFSLRLCLRAQWEIRRVAEKMLELVKPLAPVVFEKAGPPCLRGPCPEGEEGCGKLEEVRSKYLG